MIKSYLKLLSILGFFTVHADTFYPKVLLLIIDSDNAPVYAHLRANWRIYMHNHPIQIESYFLRADPTISKSIIIHNDTITVKTIENWTTGTLNKTILALSALSPKIESNFDFIIRTNLSTFYIFDRLINFLQHSPKTNFYSGFLARHNSTIYASGSGFILSKDVAKVLIHNKQELLNLNEWDDVAIGKFLALQGIYPVNHSRIDIPSFSNYEKIIQQALRDSDTFQLRIKLSEPRIPNEIIIKQHALKTFYPNLQL